MNQPRGRPFQPGNTVGRGRPKGSRNKNKPPGQRLIEDYAESLVRKCIVLAMQGNLGALRMCMERITPARRQACIQMNLPLVRTAKDVAQAGEKVTDAIRRGQLTPGEGQTMMHMLESQSRVIERAQLEARVERVEQILDGGASPATAHQPVSVGDAPPYRR